MAVSKLDKAKVALVTSYPFWASILMKRKIIFDRTIKTAAVDQRSQIYVNPDWIEERTVDEIVFVLAHEVGHVIGQHATRRGTRQHKKWNTAGDAWINDMLKEAGIGDFIEGCVDMPGSKDRTVDDIYNGLPDNPNGNGGGSGDGIGDDLIERGDPMTDEEATQLDANIRVEISQALQAAKAKGENLGSLTKVLADLIDPGTPWFDILERYMVSKVASETTWARPNRRFQSIAYLPSTGKVPEMGVLCLQVDVSGSIQQKELAYYNGHFSRIVELCNPREVHVLYTDTSVCKHEVFEQGEPVSLQFYSGGGTDMEEGFAYLAKEGIEPEVFVCLTDGYTDFNAENAPGFPVIWCISSDIVAPYGENIHFSME